MADKNGQTVEVTFDDETIKMLEACAIWRKVPVTDLVRAYVEDWIDIDYPESQGRLTRRGIHRDGPITLDPYTQQTTSRSWKEELKGRDS